MEFFFLKEWIYLIILLILFSSISIYPAIITRYGIRTKKIDTIVRSISTILFIGISILIYPLLLDTIGFYHKNYEYIKNTTCTISFINKSSRSLRNSLGCQNEEIYSFGRKLHYKEGDKIIIYYLPNTKHIIYTDFQ